MVCEASCDSVRVCAQVLVFSHSVKMLNIIEQLTVRAGYHYARLDGSTKREERQALCDSFNQSPSIFLFLISTTAGGLGLNLTAANKYASLCLPIALQAFGILPTCVHHARVRNQSFGGVNRIACVIPQSVLLREFPATASGGCANHQADAVRGQAQSQKTYHLYLL